MNLFIHITLYDYIWVYINMLYMLILFHSHIACQWQVHAFYCCYEACKIQQLQNIAFHINDNNNDMHWTWDAEDAGAQSEKFKLHSMLACGYCFFLPPTKQHTLGEWVATAECWRMECICYFSLAHWHTNIVYIYILLPMLLLLLFEMHSPIDNGIQPTHNLCIYIYFRQAVMILCYHYSYYYYLCIPDASMHVSVI